MSAERVEFTTVSLETMPDQIVVAVILFDGRNWILKTVQPPSAETMSDLKAGLELLASKFLMEGF